MKSRSEELEIKRNWSIIPVRALLDRKMNNTELRTLSALCIFTNSHGVCWPGVKTIGAILDADPGTVSRNIARLVKAGYVRRLRPQDYQQEYAKFGKINRYQVLYDPLAPLPTWEEVQTSISLAPAKEAPEAPINRIGGLGEDAALSAISHTLARAYAATLERRTGQARNIANEINTARRLAEKGVTVQQVTEATEALCRAAIERRGGLPFLADVARHLNAAP